MVNMNTYEDPSIYGLTDQLGRVFYIGRTSINAKNRWWQHKARARTGHNSPVYRRMREIGVDHTSWVVLERFADIPEEFTPRSREAWWIEKYVTEGFDLCNALGRDGVPDSWTEEMRERGVPSRRGKHTWIYGKRGDEAGWTEERRHAQSEMNIARRIEREQSNPSHLLGRLQKIEMRDIRSIQRSAALEYRDSLVKAPKSPKMLASHGTRTMWEKYKCKCQDCRDAGARHNAKRRGNPDWESATARPNNLHEIHGTIARYKHGGCRCDECRAAMSEHRRKKSERESTIES